MIEKEQYPIGRYEEPSEITEHLRVEWINVIIAFPSRIKETVETLTDAQLDTPYREKGWTVRQVVHHLADSNVNCFDRIKFALTEENPIIKPFTEEHWAELYDAKRLPIFSSLKILDGIHERWSALLKSLKEPDWKRTFFHPDLNKSQSIEQAIAKYSWHCNHHLAQIQNLKQKSKWI